MGNVSPPTGGLKGNSNYFLYAGGAALKNVSVAIDVTTDIVGNIGFSFQLNAYSPAGATTEDGWQQYIIQLQTGDGFPGSTTPSTLYGQIEPWPQSTSGFSPTTGSDLINDYITLQSLPNSSTILKGYKLTISLENDGSTGNVRYVTFVVVDNLGNTQYNHKTDIVGLKLDTTGKKATTSDLSPIVAFELNFVGPTSGEQSYLWSGAGTITYTADNTMTVVSALPSPDPADTNWVTVEDANSTYGKLPDTPSKSFTQTFSTVDPPAFTPGGPIAVSRQFGDNVTDVFAIDRGGLLVVFYVSGSGRLEVDHGALVLRASPVATPRLRRAAIRRRQSDRYFCRRPERTAECVLDRRLDRRGQWAAGDRSDGPGQFRRGARGLPAIWRHQPDRCFPHRRQGPTERVLGQCRRSVERPGKNRR